MACPYFFPIRAADSEVRPQPARAPLGKVFEGECRAGDLPAKPAPARLYSHCNFGYGRGCCELFPAGAEADAVRFTRFRDELIWILEKEWSPVRHGKGLPTGDLLARQAAAFLDA